jgi:hypothetical protein
LQHFIASSIHFDVKPRFCDMKQREGNMKVDWPGNLPPPNGKKKGT